MGAALMKTLVLILALATATAPVCIAADPDPAFVALLHNNAQWALRYIGSSSNATQRVGYMRNINEYGAVLQEYIGQKPTACVGDPHAFIENLEKLARARTAALKRVEDAQRAAALNAAVRALGPNTSGEDFLREQRMNDAERRMRYLEQQNLSRIQNDNARRFNEKR